MPIYLIILPTLYFSAELIGTAFGMVPVFWLDAVMLSSAACSCAGMRQPAKCVKREATRPAS